MSRQCYVLGMVASVWLAGCTMEMGEQAPSEEELAAEPTGSVEQAANPTQPIFDQGVGVVKVDGTACPVAQVSIYLDMQDDGQCDVFGCDFTSWQDGYDSDWVDRNQTWASGDALRGTGVRLNFCVDNGVKFRRLVGRAYSLLKLGNTCPPGSFDQNVIIDTEDDDNENKVRGNIYPSTVTSSRANLRFCTFGADPLGYPGYYFADVRVPYAVFHDFNALPTSTIPLTWVKAKKFYFFDDENDDSISRPAPSPLGEMLDFNGDGFFFELARVR